MCTQRSQEVTQGGVVCFVSFNNVRAARCLSLQYPTKHEPENGSNQIGRAYDWESLTYGTAWAWGAGTALRQLKVQVHSTHNQRPLSCRYFERETNADRWRSNTNTPTLSHHAPQTANLTARAISTYARTHRSGAVAHPQGTIKARGRYFQDVNPTFVQKRPLVRIAQRTIAFFSAVCVYSYGTHLPSRVLSLRPARGKFAGAPRFAEVGYPTFFVLCPSLCPSTDRWLACSQLQLSPLCVIITVDAPYPDLTGEGRILSRKGRDGDGKGRFLKTTVLVVLAAVTYTVPKADDPDADDG